VTPEAVEPTLNNWYAIQTSRRRSIRRNTQPTVIHKGNNRPRRGTTESPLSDQDSLNNNNHSCYKFSNEKKYGVIVQNRLMKLRHYEGNINGLKPFGEHSYLISGIKNLRDLQAGGLSLIETTVECKKYEY
jgi:hypothetical protein